MPTDDMAATAAAAQKFIERYHRLENVTAIIAAMRDDIDTAIADGINYQTPLVSGIYELCARWPDVAPDIGTVRSLAESYATLLEALASKQPRPLLHDTARLWELFAEAQGALDVASRELDRIVSTKKPHTYEAWPVPPPRK